MCDDEQLHAYIFVGIAVVHCCIPIIVINYATVTLPLYFHVNKYFLAYLNTNMDA